MDMLPSLDYGEYLTLCNSVLACLLSDYCSLNIGMEIENPCPLFRFFRGNYTIY